MTQDEIIRMAREAGFASLDYLTHNRLERFAALVAAHAKSEQINLAYQQGYEEGSAHEREACAKVCEQLGALNTATPQKLAAAIRARGENASS